MTCKSSVVVLQNLSGPLGEHIEDEDLRYPLQGFAILHLASIFGLHQALSKCVLADKDLEARGHRPC